MRHLLEPTNRMLNGAQLSQSGERSFRAPSTQRIVKPFVNRRVGAVEMPIYAVVESWAWRFFEHFKLIPLTHVQETCKRKKNSAVAVIADRTALLHTIVRNSRDHWSAWVFKLIYSFKLKYILLMPVITFSRSLCSVAKRHTLQQKCLKKWIGIRKCRCWTHRQRNAMLRSTVGRRASPVAGV